jgi:hypothetical protein
LKQEDALTTFLFDSALAHAIRRVQVNMDGLKINGTHQRIVYIDNVNTLDRRVHTIKKNTGAGVVDVKENGPEVNADKTKYMVISLDQNAGRSHNKKMDNSSFEVRECLQ